MISQSGRNKLDDITINQVFTFTPTLIRNLRSNNINNINNIYNGVCMRFIKNDCPAFKWEIQQYEQLYGIAVCLTNLGLYVSAIQ